MTGTRFGMTDAQKLSFGALLNRLDCVSLHHGDCVGADAEAHDIAEDLNTDIFIAIHPPTSDVHRAFKEGDSSWPEKGYFERNRDIVDSSEVLIGCPATAKQTKGGTWYTINYGCKVGKPVFIILPNGKVNRPTNQIK